MFTPACLRYGPGAMLGWKWDACKQTKLAHNRLITPHGIWCRKSLYCAFFLMLIIFYSVIYSCCYLLYGNYFWIHIPKKAQSKESVDLLMCEELSKLPLLLFSLACWWIMSSKLTVIKEPLMKRICKCPPLPGMSAVFIQGCCSPLSPPPVAHFLPSSLLISRLRETLPITHLVNLFHLVPLISHVSFLPCD